MDWAHRGDGVPVILTNSRSVVPGHQGPAMLGSHLDGSRDLHSGQGRITQIFPSERIGGILLEAIRDLTVAVLRRKKDISAQIPRGG